MKEVEEEKLLIMIEIHDPALDHHKDHQTESHQTLE